MSSGVTRLERAAAAARLTFGWRTPSGPSSSIVAMWPRAPTTFSFAARGAPAAVKDVVLLDSLDGESQRTGGHADRDLVALFLSDQRAADRRLDRDAAGRRIALHGAHEVEGLNVAFGVDDLDGRAGLSDARVRVLDDLRATDHLLQLVDPAVEQSDLFLRLFVLGVVFDVARLKRLLQALTRLSAPHQRDLQGALDLLH